VETKVCVRRFEVVEWRKFKDELIECGPTGKRTIRFKRSFLLGASERECAVPHCKKPAELLNFGNAASDKLDAARSSKQKNGAQIRAAKISSAPQPAGRISPPSVLRNSPD
jgi:hypothetical protein